MRRFFSNVVAAVAVLAASAACAGERPNILVAISDDQSFAHVSAAGCPAVNTPAFDRIARDGVRFVNAMCASPGCSPSRAALLTGRYPWQIQHAGTHASEFPATYAVYPDILEQAGYFVGYTGKGWGPGNWKISGRTRNPAGNAFDQATQPPPAAAISNRDYAGCFRDFLAARPAGRPFCFWYGASEPHRAFEPGSGQRLGKNPGDVRVPEFLPDHPVVRGDLLDYFAEIEHFDRHLGRMIELLEQSGELDQTIIVVTSDNGMAFPRAKANCYEYGIHVPMAIRWPGPAAGGRAVEDLVGFVDLAPTFLDAAGLDVPASMTGRSLVGVMTSTAAGHVDAARDAVFAARERHSSSREGNLGYPQRAIRTSQYLLVRNFRPDRWPAGAPQKYDAGGKLGPMHGAYHDIDACPTLSLLVEQRDDPAVSRFFHLAVDKRPEFELFDVRDDPACVDNLAGEPRHADTLRRLADRLDQFLRETGDPRVLDGGEVFETYKRYSPIRSFPADDSGAAKR